jgi:hypothetical protein
MKSFFTVLILAGSVLTTDVKIEETKKQVQRIALLNKSLNSGSNEKDTEVDSWGVHLKYIRESSIDKILYIVSSNGPDKIFGTDDDISAIAVKRIYKKIDHNKIIERHASPDGR